MNLTGRIDHVGVRAGGLPALIVNVKVRNASKATVCVVSSSAEIYLSVGRYAGITDSAALIGIGNVEPQAHGADGEAIWRIIAPISSGRAIQHFEHLRQGEDVMLLVNIRAGVSIIDAEGRTQYATTCVSSEEYSTSHCALRIARSDWINLLGPLGYTKHYMIEIPLAWPRVSELEKPLTHLAAAWDHCHNARDADALASCYRCLESVAKAFGAENPDQNGWEKILKQVEPKKREKLKHLLHSVGSFMHLGRHEHPEGNFVVMERVDAEFALLTTHAAVLYLSRAIAWNPETPPPLVQTAGGLSKD